MDCTVASRKMRFSVPVLKLSMLSVRQPYEQPNKKLRDSVVKIVLLNELGVVIDDISTTC